MPSLILILLSLVDTPQPIGIYWVVWSILNNFLLVELSVSMFVIDLLIYRNMLLDLY